jgi:hypothetical protein
MSLRDLDLVIGTILVLVATLLSRLADPAVAIVILSLLVMTTVLALGEDRIADLWRAYTAAPPPRPPRKVASLLERLPAPAPASMRPTELARARVITRSERDQLRVV